MTFSIELYRNMCPLPLHDLFPSAEAVNKTQLPMLPMHWNRDLPEQSWRNEH